MDAEKEKIIGKVKKLMALAGNNPNRFQAEEAMRKAQELLGKYHLSMSCIETDKPEEAVEGVLEDGSKKVHTWKCIIAKIVANNFRCDVLKVRRPGVRYYQLVLIGEEIDLGSAEEVYRMAIKYFDSSWKTYKKTQKIETGVSLGSADRNSYYFGFRNGLKEAFERNVKSDAGTALMVVKPDSVIRYFRSKSMRTTRTSLRSSGNQHARTQGYGDGARFSHRGAIQ